MIIRRTGSEQCLLEHLSIRIFPVKCRYMTEYLHQFGFQLVTDPLNHFLSCLPVFSIHPDFEQLVVGQGIVNFRQDSIGYACLSCDDNRFQIVGLGTQGTFLPGR